MAITIGIKKIFSLGSYPEADFGLLKEAGVEVIHLNKEKIRIWAKKIIDRN